MVGLTQRVRLSSVHLHGREDAVQDWGTQLLVGGCRQDLVAHGVVPQLITEDVLDIRVHDRFLAGHLLQVLQGPLAARFEVDVPRQGCIAAHHAPANAALLLQSAQEEVEVIHAGERHDAEARNFQSVPSVAVAIGREELVVYERLDAVDGAGVLEHMVLDLVEPVLTVEPHHIEGARFGESQGASDLGRRDRQLGRPGHDVVLLAAPDGFLATVSDRHGRTGVLAPLVVLDHDDAIAISSEFAADGERCGSNAFTVDDFGQLVASFGVRDDDEPFHLARCENLAERFGCFGEPAHVVGLSIGASLEQTRDDGDHCCFLWIERLGFIPLDSRFQTRLVTGDLVSRALGTRLFMIAYIYKKVNCIMVLKKA